jgi:hypothetical protein
MLDRLKSALADRYTIERELGGWGMKSNTIRQYDSKIPVFHPCERSQNGYVRSQYGNVYA